MEFLTTAEQPNEPLLYQYVTDIMFESAVKEVVAPEEVTDETEYIEAFTFEKENAVRYVLQKNKANKPINGILQEFIESDPTKTNGPAQEWTSVVDRGV